MEEQNKVSSLKYVCLYVDKWNYYYVVTKQNGGSGLCVKDISNI